MGSKYRKKTNEYYTPLRDSKKMGAYEVKCPTFVDKECLRLYKSIVEQASTHAYIRKALETLDSAFRLYSPENVAVAFNGGKDATVVMHLARAALANWCNENATSAELHCLYMCGAEGEQFSEVNSFVREQVSAYQLSAVEVHLGIKEGICKFTKERDNMCAFILGTRRSDPHGATMEHFEPSSKGWPPFMRVNPVLTWHYHDVWEFLRHFRLPYCCLYDRGYTSLGSVATTGPNPALKNDENERGYEPAWMLEDESLERAGRVSKSQ
ncbi:unnamed protein product [Agarophyton chilense]